MPSISSATQPSDGTIPAPHHAQPGTIITTAIMPIALLLLFVYVLGARSTWGRIRM